MKILKELYETLISMIKDFRSTRERILWSSINVFIFTLIFSKDAVICGLVSGWVTIVLTYYFASKNSEHKQKHNLEMRRDFSRFDENSDCQD